MFCRKCGNQIPDNSLFCLKCGMKTEKSEVSDIEENDDFKDVSRANTVDIGKKNDTIVLKEKVALSSKQKIGITIGCIIALILIVFTWQNSVVTSVKTLYEQGKYEEAEKKLQSVWVQSSLGTLPNEIEILSDVYYYYNKANEYKYETGVFTQISYIDYSLKTIATCIGLSQDAEKNGLSDKLISIKKTVAQELANDDIDVVNRLKILKNDSSYYFSPLDYMDKKKCDELINNIVNDISQSEVEYYKNERNPINIKDFNAYKEGKYYYCSGTVTNVSSTSHSYVKVRVTYYDKNGDVLTTDWAYAVGSEGIRAGENQQFEIMTKLTGSPDQYRVEVQEYK